MAHPAVSKRQPLAVVERSRLDGGRVWCGEAVRFTFRIANAGDAPLELRASPSCGCTIAAGDRTVAPGRTGSVRAELHTGSMPGRLTKDIVVATNDPRRPRLVLQVSVEVSRAITVLPSAYASLDVDGEAPTVHEVTLRVERSERVLFPSVTCSAPYARAALDPVARRDAGAWVHTLRVSVGAGAPFGRSLLTVIVATTLPSQPHVAIFLTCDRGIVVLPPSLYLGDVSTESPLALPGLVTLTRDRQPFRLRSIECEDPCLRVQQETVADGHTYRLRVRYLGGWGPGSIKRAVTVRTDDTAQPVIDIPVTARAVAPTPIAR